MSEKELEKFSEDELGFEKFSKHKKIKGLDRKKSLRDFRGKEDKRSFKKEKENDKTRKLH